MHRTPALALVVANYGAALAVQVRPPNEPVGFNVLADERETPPAPRVAAAQRRRARPFPSAACQG
eukprot:scaffold60604_cov57-Phaeocystis_antarctica.AAC.2